MSGASPPDTNPILSAYETFARQTPFVTRCVISTQIISCFLSFFFDLSGAFANIPYFTILNFEVYRIITSPIICDGLISAFLAYIYFSENGRRLEISMGSTAFGAILLSIGLISNLGHLMLTFLLYAITGSNAWLLQPALGIWIFFWGLLAMECAQTPAGTTRRLLFASVPSAYVPVVLLSVFSMLGGVKLAHVISTITGYAYGYGYLDKLMVGGARAKRLEDTTLNQLVHREGWIASNQALGTGAWAEHESSNRGTGGLASLFASGEPRAQNLSATSTQEDRFPSGGHRLGTTTSRKKSTNPRQARLAAIEGKQESSGDSNV